MDSWEDTEPEAHFTKIKIEERVRNKVKEKDNISFEQVGSCSYLEEVQEVHSILFRKVLEEVDNQPPSSSEGEKNLILLKTVQLKIEEDDIQGPCLTHQPAEMQTMLQTEAGFIQSLEKMPDSMGIQENPGKILAISLPEGIYAIHEMEVINGPKETPAFHEDRWSIEKDPDIPGIQVDREKDTAGDEVKDRQLLAAEEGRIRPLPDCEAADIPDGRNKATLLHNSENKEQSKDSLFQPPVAISSDVPSETQESIVQQGIGKAIRSHAQFSS
ncbi:uncharacterized protein LOC134492871 [Candoia aspera]|uniref:uncharacterized protein LOC134492871 n=1 Tax=Candoia aspera TaxID=51853 RepID=UPI002FD7BA17